MATHPTRHNAKMANDTSKYHIMFIGNYRYDGWKCGASVNADKPAFRTYNDYLALRASGPSQISASNTKSNKGATK